MIRREGAKANKKVEKKIIHVGWEGNCREKFNEAEVGWEGRLHQVISGPSGHLGSV